MLAMPAMFTMSIRAVAHATRATPRCSRHPHRRWRHGGGWRAALGARVRRALKWAGIALAVLLGLIAIFIAVVVGMVVAPTHNPFHAHVTDPLANVKPYYLALGDSLAFGFQPNFDWAQGYAPQWYVMLQHHRAQYFTDYGCNGATTQDFIHGGCPYQLFVHSSYNGSQLQAAIHFLKLHPGQVSPVSLDIGADDILPLVGFENGHCTLSNGYEQALTAMDANLTKTILPQLLGALRDGNGYLTGELMMMNYYDPFYNACPNERPFGKDFRLHLEQDARQFGVPVVDVHAAYGGDNPHNPNLCNYTWICSPLHSVHPTSAGYGVIAQAFERLLTTRAGQARAVAACPRVPAIEGG